MFTTCPECRHLFSRGFAQCPYCGLIRNTSIYNYAYARNMVVGSSIRFGPYIWRVLAVEMDQSPEEHQLIRSIVNAYRHENNIAAPKDTTAPKAKALLITRDILEKREFDSSSDDWDESEIKSWLNSEFLNRFDAVEKLAIINRRTISFQTRWDPGYYGTLAGSEVFLLSDEEALFYFQAKEDRIAYYECPRGRMPYPWWLRTPARAYFDSDYIAYVDDDGSINRIGEYCSWDIGVRPALWLNFTDFSDYSVVTPTTLSAHHWRGSESDDW